jgi:hypothetical protein
MLVVVLSVFIYTSNGFNLIRPKIEKRNVIYSTLNAEASSEIDFVGYKLWCTFTGFGAVNMTNGIEFKEKSQTDFALGVTASGPRYWRLINNGDNKITIETTHPVRPEYMLFFDIWEPTLLWKGDLDFTSMKVSNGVVLSRKKFLGIFPYTDTIATFTADVLKPEEDFPNIAMPKSIKWTVIITSWKSSSFT